MGKRTQLEVSLQFTTVLLDEYLPHEATSGVIREGEVDGLVEELLELLL